MGPVAAAASTVGAGLLSFLGGERQRRTSIDLANTQYQRAVQDLKKAGLNPMLAIGGQAAVPNIGSPESEGVASAQQARQVASMIELQDEQAKATREAGQASKAAARASIAQEAKGLADAARTNALAHAEWQIMQEQLKQIRQNTASAAAQERLTNTEATLRRLLIPGAQNEARMQESWFGRALPYVRPIAGAVGGLSSAAARFFSKPVPVTTTQTRHRAPAGRGGFVEHTSTTRSR